MTTLIGDLPAIASQHDGEDLDKFSGQLTPAQGEALRALRAVIFEHDRLRAFGDLRRVQTPTGDLLWVCRDHHHEYDPGLPKVSDLDSPPAKDAGTHRTHTVSGKADGNSGYPQPNINALRPATGMAKCRECGVRVEPKDLICFRCGANLPHAPFPDEDIRSSWPFPRARPSLATGTTNCPDCGVRVEPYDLICFRCGANLPHAPFPDDDIPFLPNCGTPVQDPAEMVCIVGDHVIPQGF